MTNAPIRVMLVDDHAVVTEALTVLLETFEDVEVVGATTEGASATALFLSLRPDVVLVDLSMPEVDGVEVTRRLTSADPTARVVALTGIVDARLVQRIVEAGALGYLLKSVGAEELVDAIRRAAAGGAVLSAEALGDVARGQRAQLGDDLTPRELEVLHSVAQGLSNKEIARELGVTAGTVRIHVSNILNKLRVPNRTSAAFVARNHGLVADGVAAHLR